MTTTTPRNMAIIKLEAKKASVINTAVPTLRDGYMIVKTVAVALNPSDWKSLDGEGNEGTISGLDYAGIVVEVGSKVEKFKKGDRVMGASFGANTASFQGGAFAEFILVKGNIQMHIPERMSFQEAAALPVTVGTNAIALYEILKLPLLPLEKEVNEKVFLFVYGGSTAAGTMAIQLAKLSGFTVITTCSAHNFEMVKSYGADAVFDYHDPECGKKIHEHTIDNLTHVFDTITEPESTKICEEAISSNGGTICGVSPPQITRTDIKSDFVFAYIVFGEKFVSHGMEWPVRTELVQWYIGIFGPVMQALLDEGKIKSHPVSVGMGGLDGVLGGLEELKGGKVSGKKLVYRIADTQGIVDK